MNGNPDRQAGLLRRIRQVLRDDLHLTSLGFAFMGLLLASMAAATWWVGHTQDATMRRAQAQQVRAVGTVLAETAESLLADGQLTRLRRLVVETARKAGLDRCRVVLPDGGVLADAEPANITAAALPSRWTGEVTVKSASPDALSATFPVSVPGRGNLAVEVAARPDPSAEVFWQTRAGLGAVCAGALALLVVMHRRFRSAFRGLWAVRHALVARRAGQRRPDALRVNPAWGEEAEAWNAILAELEAARREATLAQTHETLRRQGEAHSELSAACDALAQGLILVDDEGRARYLNSAAAVLLRTRREHAKGQQVAAFLDEPRLVEAVREATRRPMQRREIVEVERTGPAGRMFLRFIVRPVRREDSAAAMIVIEDITQQRVAQEARSTFLAQATHELRTPLTNIRAYAEMGLEEGRGDPAVQANCLSVINQEAHRLERMVSDILSVSEIEAGAMKLNLDDVRLAEVFDALQDDYAAQAKEKGVALRFDLPPKLPVIRGDREKLLLGLHNLIGNAIKYTPSGGSVTVTVTVEGGRLSVAVADTGIGMTEEDCARVFEKFYRGSDPRIREIEGSGLGLAIAREVVRLHGGDITVESAPDQGSTFTLTLPVLEGVPVA